jgi:small multidrug resistance pump
MDGETRTGETNRHWEYPDGADQLIVRTGKEFFMCWLWLFLAIVLEVAATVCMKLSDGFHRLMPTVMMVLLYLASFAPMAWAMKRLEVGIVYAVWSAAGTALITLIGMIAFREQMTLTKMGAIALIVVGVVLLNVATSEHPRSGDQIAEAPQTKQLR